MIKKILLTYFLLLGIRLMASSPAMGEILYRNIGGLKYEIQFKVGRDCRGIPNNRMYAKIYNDSFSIDLATTRVSIKSQFSQGCTNGCNPPNQTSGQGLEIHLFLDTVDFSVAPFNKFGTSNRPYVYFAHENCCRNGAINAFSPGNFYVDAMLNVYYLRTQNEIVNTPQFYEVLDYLTPVNFTFSHSFASIKAFEADSIAYELDRPMNTFNNFQNYHTGYPISFKCNSPSVNQCSPSLGVNPTRGFYFDPVLGNLIFTPVNLDMTCLVLKRNIYRKINNQSILVGFTKIDQQLRVFMQGDAPYCNQNSNIQIKAREQFCRDFIIKDNKDDTSKRVDTIAIIIHQQPKFGTLSLVDSNAVEKTLRYCWTPQINDYVSKKQDYFVFTAKHNKCFSENKQKITKAVSVDVIAPDSFSYYTIKTFSDVNQNGIKDVNEVFKPANFIINNYSILNIQNTNQFGVFQFIRIKENLEFSILNNALNTATTSPIAIQSEFDSSYTILLGFYETPGIKGRIIFDNNLNCQLDTLEAGLSGFKIIESNSKNIGISDNSGNFFIPFNGGNYNLTLDLQNKFKINCSAPLIGFLNPDSVLNQGLFYLGYDNKKDLSISQNSNYFQRNNSQYSSDIIIRNNSTSGFSPSKIKLKTSQKLNGFSSATSFLVNTNHILFSLDSIKPLETKVINYKHFIFKDTNYINKQLCFDLEILINDDDLVNNHSLICEPIYDTFCCQTSKLSYSPFEINEIDPVVKYKIVYKNPISSSNSFYVLTDVLDTSTFDVTSFKILENPFQFKTQINGNELRAELINPNININNQIYLLFEIGFKRKIDDFFTIQNTATWTTNLSTQQSTNQTLNQTVSAIALKQISPNAICQGQSVTIDFSTRYEPNSNNRFQFILSDAQGNFIDSNMVFDTLMSKSDKVTFNVPASVVPGDYYIKIKGTSPAAAIFESEIFQGFTINKKPEIVLKSNIKNQIVCDGDSVILNAMGDQEFQFFFNNTPFHNYNPKNRFAFLPNASGQLFVKTRTDQNCINSSETINFELKPKPFTEIQLLQDEVCNGDSVFLELYGAKSYDIYYDFDSVKNYMGYEYNMIANLNLKKFIVVGKNEFACQTSDSIEFEVFPYTEKPIIGQLNNVLYSNYTNNNQWYKNNEIIVGATANSYTPTEDGIYKVSNKPNFKCLSFSDDFVFRKTSVYQNTFQNAIITYPNPSNTVLTIDNSLTFDFEFEIYNINGKKLNSIAVSKGLNFLDVSQFNSGLYILKGIVDGQNIEILFSVAH